MASQMAYEYQKFESFRFHVADYIVFFLMIALSTAIGIYYGYFRKNVKRRSPTDTTDFGSSEMGEYLLGSRNLRVFPVAMSLVASYISGVTMLGTPSEVYRFGIQYLIITIAIIFMGITVAFVYLPVFHAVKVSSSYEYLDMRFNHVVRTMASIIFILDEIFFLPMIVYVPAIAFEQVTGVRYEYTCIVLVVICLIYTIIGGIKAVVHTDAWQILIMFLSVLVVVSLGSALHEDFPSIFVNAQEGGRLNVILKPSFYERQTLVSILVGGFVYWTGFNSVNQTMVQRYMSLSNLRKARWAVAIFCCGVILFISMCSYAGLLIYDYYRNCDPLAANLIDKEDQIFPLYVMATVGYLHGIPGLFVAGIFGAAMSSLSVVLNSTALVLLEDILKGCFKVKLSPRGTNIFVKSSIAVLGVVAFGGVFIIKDLSGILSAAQSLTGIAASVSFGIFTLGMLVPFANSWGAIFGGVVGFAMSCWVSFGYNAAIASGKVVPKQLEISVSECVANITLPQVEEHDESGVFFLYRLSFWWLSPIGVLTTVLVGIFVSLVTKPTKVRTLDANLLSPVIHRFLPSECFVPRKKAEPNAATQPLRDSNSSSKK